MLQTPQSFPTDFDVISRPRQRLFPTLVLVRIYHFPRGFPPPPYSQSGKQFPGSTFPTSPAHLLTPSPSRELAARRVHAAHVKAAGHLAAVRQLLLRRMREVAPRHDRRLRASERASGGLPRQPGGEGNFELAERSFLFNLF